jgi:putative acetyltransferase
MSRDALPSTAAASPLPAGFLLRPITPRDDAPLARLFEQILGEEFDETPEMLRDMIPEYTAMSAQYDRPGAQYLVLEHRGEVIGGGGIGPLLEQPRRICELQKMYLARPARGRRLGVALLERCLAFARSEGYQACYLDTRLSMVAARSLYEKHGFRQLDAPLVDTGHYICDAFYLRELG